MEIAASLPTAIVAMSFTMSQGISVSLCKLEPDAPHIIFKQRDLTLPGDSPSLSPIYLYTAESESSEQTRIAIFDMERLNIAGIAMCGSIAQINKKSLDGMVGKVERCGNVNRM
jgi:hypothetical protein